MVAGTREQNEAMFPGVVLEMFDKDSIGSDDFLGRAKSKAILRTLQKPAVPVLEWVPLRRSLGDAGEVLAAFELVHMMDIDDFPLPPKKMIREAFTKSRKSVVPIPKASCLADVC